MGSRSARSKPVGPLSTRARLSGLVEASHPFPILMVVSLTVLVGLVSSDGGVEAGRLLLAALAMLLSQLSIGWSNDYLDRQKDAVYQPEKPVPSGRVSAPVLPPLVGLALAGSLGAGVALGASATALLVAGTACGFAYNFGLKDTALSWTAYIAAFALLPLFVWTALAEFRGDFVWLYAVGAPLAVAAHIANTLPDIAADAAAGRRGVAVVLGREKALAVLTACLALPLAMIAASLMWTQYEAAILGPTVVAYLLLLVSAAMAYRAQPFERAARRAFRVVAAACVVLASGWLASV